MLQYGSYIKDIIMPQEFQIEMGFGDTFLFSYYKPNSKRPQPVCYNKCFFGWNLSALLNISTLQCLSLSLKEPWNSLF